ncbi:MAG TPA: hypothetical protein VJ438_03990, partial [Candidatus Nanoarchaeia archaeon]|nr:hypothetical protein [Candidatus Nanoarchaeia archaeon]
SLLGGLNKVDVGAKRLFVSGDYLRTDNWINTKSAMAYVLTSDKGKVDRWAEENKIKRGDYAK